MKLTNKLPLFNLFSFTCIVNYFTPDTKNDEKNLKTNIT